MSCGRSTIKEGGGRVLGSTRATYRHTNQRNERGEVAGKRNVNRAAGTAHRSKDKQGGPAAGREAVE